MNEIVPLDQFEDPVLRQMIHQKLTSLKDYEQEIPAVFIVHDLLHNNVLYMSPRGLAGLGITLDEVRNLSKEEYFNRYFGNP
ncbi:hypothetical protein V9K67_11565 [Paraflavisolibacter sp. H34]|uniref:hypothetical protein n=1 Tax=Huijunlia imazamoxiresistens TaxID=3127457 RepID=UPI00301B237A